MSYKEQYLQHSFLGRQSSTAGPLAFARIIHNHSTMLLALLFMALILMASAETARAQTPAEAIGQVETLRGSATAIRTGSTVFNLNVGDPVFLGDIVQTGRASTLGITFLDQTVFSLAANARMQVDDLVYNATGSANSLAINLVEGTFVFLAGKIADTGTMRVNTRVAQIGIRGTLPWVSIGATTSFAILSERDGTTGEYVLLRNGTNTVIGTVNLATVGTTRKLIMTSPNDDPQTVDKTSEELAAEQILRNEIFNTLDTRDTRLGIAPDPAPDPNQGPPPGNQGGGGPPPGNQGSVPGTDPTNAAAAAVATAVLIDQANAVVAACSQTQAKINRALQLYHRGLNSQSRQLLQDARSDVNRLPPGSCGTLLERITQGQQVIDQAQEDETSTETAINSCNENEINRLRERYASSRQNSAPVILARLEEAADNCAGQRIQKDRAQEKSQANAECRRRNGRGYYAGKVRADGSFKCRTSVKERSRQAWAACRRQYGSRLANVKIFKSGKYRCILRNVVRRKPPPPPPRREPPQQGHDPATSAAIIGGFLGAIQGVPATKKAAAAMRIKPLFTANRAADTMAIRALPNNTTGAPGSLQGSIHRRLLIKSPDGLPIWLWQKLTMRGPRPTCTT